MAGGRKNKRKKGRGAKKAGGGSADGGGSGDDCHGVSADGLVAVVFVDNHMHFFKFVEPTDLVLQAWLDGILQESFSMWNEHLPGVECGDLMVQASPPLPVEPVTFLEWNGIAHVELKEGREGFGLVERLIEVQQKILLSEEKVDVEPEGRHSCRLEAEVARLHQEVSQGRIGRLEQAEGVSQDRIGRLEEEAILANATSIKMQSMFDDMRNALDLEVRLNNEVRRRVPLSIARDKIISALGKGGLQPGQSWKTFFAGFTVGDWQMVFDQTKGESEVQRKVKELLGVGSVRANHLIHSVES